MVKDRRGYLIRGASLRLRALPSRHVANGATRAAFTNRLGRAAFGLKLKASGCTCPAANVLTLALRAATSKHSVTKSVTLGLPAAVTR